MVIEACRPGDFPDELLPALHVIRAGLLIRLGRYADASLTAREGLNHASEDKLLESVLWERLAVAGSKLGQSAEADQAIARSLNLRKELLAAGDAGVIQLLQQTAAALRREGREAEAIEIENQLPPPTG